MSEGLTTVYRNDPRLGAMPQRARLLVGEASFRHETGEPEVLLVCPCPTTPRGCCVLGGCGYPCCVPGEPIEHCSPTACPDGERRAGAIE